MSALAIWLFALLMENAGRFAFFIGFRVIGGYFFKKAISFRKRLPQKVFMTPGEFFKPYLNRSSKSLIHHDVKLVDREDEVVNLARGIINRDWPIVILSGAPGQGKSRFVLELSKVISVDRRSVWQKLLFRGATWKSYFVNTAVADVLAHVDQLPRRHPVALFIDDAANNPSLVRSLADYALANEDEFPLVLVFTSRAYLLPTILDAMPPVRPVHSFILSRLSVDGIGKIIDELVPNISIVDRNRFVQLTRDSPFLAVLLCDAIRSGLSLAVQLSDEQLRRRLCDEPIEKATSRCGIALPNVLVALAGICAVAPYEGRNAELRSAVKSLAELNDAEFDCILKSALDSGLFIEYGAAKIRPAPDLVGDLILDRVLLSDAGGTQSAIANKIMEILLPIATERVISNMADLGWIRGNTTVDLVGPILQGYKEQVKSLSVSQISGLLDRLKPIAVRRPEAILDIMETLWERINCLAPISDPTMSEWRRLLGEATPLIEGAAYTENGLVRAMVLVKDLYINAAVVTAYDNHKPLTILIEMAGFSPFRSLSLTALAMSELEQWFERGGKDAVVALEALDQILTSTVNWSESRAASMTFSSQILSLNDQVIAIRDRAVSLVEQGILSNDPKLCEKALIAVDALGRYRTGPGYAPDSPMAAQIRNEMARLANSIERIVIEGRTHRIMRKVEKCLWDWWCFSDVVIANRSAELLRRIPSDPQYQISKAIYGDSVPLETVVPDSTLLGDKSHIKYFLEEGREEFSVANVDVVLSQLKISDSATDWATFLQGIAYGEDATSWRARIVFEAITRRAPAAAISLATDYQNEPWSNDCITMLSIVRSVDYNLWNEKLQLALNDAGLSEDLAFSWLASYGREMEFDAGQVAFFEKCLNMGSERLQKLAVECLAYGKGFEWDESVRRLFRIAKTMPEDMRVLDHIFSKLTHNRSQSFISSKIGVADKEALSYLLSLSMDDGDIWHDPYWVGPYLKFIAKNYPVDFLVFLREFLSHFPSRAAIHFRILDARNAEEPIKELLTGPLRQAHLNALFELASEENVSGEFIRAVFRKVLAINEPDFQKRIERALIGGDAIKVATVLSGYRFSLDWLRLCSATLAAADRLGTGSFEKAAKLLASSFWAGTTTSRSIGQPVERDRQIASACADLSKDNSLPVRCREYFKRCAIGAENRMRSDLESDEELIGNRL